MQPMTLSAFARHMDWPQSYVSKLKKAGRLVLDDNGQVLPAPSIARIKATSDPSKKGVAQRHAQARAAKAQAAHGHPLKSEHEPADADSDNEADDSAIPGNANYQNARAMRELWNARRARLEYLESARELIPLVEHNAAFSQLGAACRRALESLCSTLPPMLAGVSEDQARERLRDEVQAALASLSAQAEELARAIKTGPSSAP